MTMKRAMTGLLSGLFLLGMVSQAQAIVMTYNVNGNFIGGGTVSGTVDIDDAGPPLVTDYDLETTAAGAFVGFNYTPANSTAFQINPGRTRIEQTGGAEHVLVLDWSPNLPGPGPFTLRPNTRENRPGTQRRTIAPGGTAVATPEPGTILLFGSGLLGLGVWRYRKNVKS